MCEPTEVDLHLLGDAALQALVVELQQQADRLEAARLRVLGEWDARATLPWAASHDAPLQAPSRAHTARASHSPSTRRRAASRRSAWCCSSTTSA